MKEEGEVEQGKMGEGKRRGESRRGGGGRKKRRKKSDLVLHVSDVYNVY